MDWVYVNLDCRPDRREHVEAEFAKHGITSRRQPGELVTRENHAPTDRTRRMYNRTPGAIGCFNAQVNALRTSPPDNDTVVCEDDICLAADLPARIEYLYSHAPSDYDILWLGATFHCNPAVWHKDTIGRDAERVGHRIFRTYGIWSTYGYIVRASSRERVLSLLDEAYQNSDGIDHAMMLYIEPVLKTYCMVPGCAWQYDAQSNIGNGVTEFSLFKKNLGPYVWANRMEDFDADTYQWGEAG
jgi:GR25 family glycosyltransferase involved in LPS biosynthesis